jgi:hypothetical protein
MIGLARLGALGAVVVASLAVPLGCSGNDKNSGVGSAKLPSGTRSEALDHEACEESGHRVETLDANNDGKPDIRTVYDKSSNKVICRIVDLNHDGKPDLYEYFDSGGTIRRREFCYDDTGVVNAIDYFENGKLVRREYDTTGQHRIDTWDFFDPNATPDPKTGRPRPIRRERDTTGDGKVDQWWTWDGDKVTIAFDKNGDGKPDPENTVTLGGVEDAGAPAACPTCGASDAGVATNATEAGPTSPPSTPIDASAPTDAGKTTPRNARPR